MLAGAEQKQGRVGVRRRQMGHWGQGGRRGAPQMDGPVGGGARLRWRIHTYVHTYIYIYISMYIYIYMLCMYVSIYIYILYDTHIYIYNYNFI